MTETTRGAAEGPTDAGVDAKADATPEDSESSVCRVCGRTFPEPRLLVLHRGVRHAGALTDEEKEAYTEAYRDEEAALHSFRIRALAVLVVLYFGVLFLYIGFAG
ncbi:DNA-binding protein [Halogeometricum sp. S1BR25-6]|uniref:DNA-binding protein n=1 Tax=Halogeometricum salsisoli TaxID=2950536 RepID=A0ABU2GF04_9EURY|nr:DNA-binding protein [Halogeometricum sp. S1BR25-6]MDS0299354.1 DNA-binding protein [Halogeometricum sp. S1BR25-6]